MGLRIIRIVLITFTLLQFFLFLNALSLICALLFTPILIIFFNYLTHVCLSPNSELNARVGRAITKYDNTSVFYVTNPEDGKNYLLDKEKVFSIPFSPAIFFQPFSLDWAYQKFVITPQGSIYSINYSQANEIDLDALILPKLESPSPVQRQGFYVRYGIPDHLLKQAQEELNARVLNKFKSR
ncbi:hypothetical protein POAR111328_09695 [Polynucleobacter arcticus]